MYRMREGHVSLRYVGKIAQPLDYMYNRLIHGWWMKCRAGAQFLKFRRKYRNGARTEECLRCGEEVENVENFYCSEIDKGEIIKIIPKVLEWDVINILRWMLSVERSREQRVAVEGYVHGLYRIREELIDGLK